MPGPSAVINKTDSEVTMAIQFSFNSFCREVFLFLFHLFQ